MVIEAVGDKHDADHEEKCQSQHLDRRMVGNEAAYRAGERHHEQYRAHDGGDHYFEPVDHPDRRDDRIEREHEIDDRDLNDHR